MITVGFDFGTHQTKICYEKTEAGTSFYEVFSFRGKDGGKRLTLPSFIRILPSGHLRYGYEAMDERLGGTAITYFKQVAFSLSATSLDRQIAEQRSVLYLAYIILNLDRHLSEDYVVHMGMPTDADPKNYLFCKCQAVKMMASAMLIVRKAFKGNLEEFLSTPYQVLIEQIDKCLRFCSANIDEMKKRFAIFVFPEAYVALIPLINDHRLPQVGPNLFVDIGGGTVDISFFTNQMDGSIGKNRPCLYYYHSIPYGLNMITGQDLLHGHNVEVTQHQITPQCVEKFRCQMVSAVDSIMSVLKDKYIELGKTSVMPFVNLCSQILDGRPICYSGGGSMFNELKLPLESDLHGAGYNFSQVNTVAGLIDHSKLHESDRMFHVLATAFSLSHHALLSNGDHDAIKLVSVDKLFSGIHIPKFPIKFEKPKNWTW